MYFLLTSNTYCWHPIAPIPWWNQTPASLQPHREKENNLMVSSKLTASSCAKGFHFTLMWNNHFIYYSLYKNETQNVCFGLFLKIMLATSSQWLYYYVNNYRTGVLYIKTVCLFILVTNCIIYKHILFFLIQAIMRHTRLCHIQ